MVEMPRCYEKHGDEYCEANVRYEMVRCNEKLHMQRVDGYTNKKKQENNQTQIRFFTIELKLLGMF